MPTAARRPDPASPVPARLAAFIRLAGAAAWRRRLADLTEHAGPRSLTARAVQQHHALELTLGRAGEVAGTNLALRHLLDLADATVALAAALPPAGVDRLRDRLAAALEGDANLVPLFHLLRTAALQRSRGFAVRFDGLADNAPYDLLISRDGSHAEIACETVSADDGRALHRGAWCSLVDLINPELQTWLAAHPGRYILKLTLPDGLSGASDLPTLHRRVMGLLQAERRLDSSDQAMLKLDPLMLAGAQASGAALPANLRAQFGPEAHLAVTTAPPSGNGPGSVFVMAARAGRENGIPAAVTRRMAAAAPARFSGAQAGLLAMFVEDVERGEWRGLRERLELEGATRRFLTDPAARPLVAVTCASRMEMFGMAPPDASPDGDLRFRNQQHPAAKLAGLQPAIASSI